MRLFDYCCYDHFCYLDAVSKSTGFRQFHYVLCTGHSYAFEEEIRVLTHQLTCAQRNRKRFTFKTMQKKKKPRKILTSALWLLIGADDIYSRKRVCRISAACSGSDEADFRAHRHAFWLLRLSLGLCHLNSDTVTQRMCHVRLFPKPVSTTVCEFK